jgi:hypothetical protein
MAFFLNFHSFVPLFNIKHDSESFNIPNVGQEPACTVSRHSSVDATFVQDGNELVCRFWPAEGFKTHEALGCSRLCSVARSRLGGVFIFRNADEFAALRTEFGYTLAMAWE